MIYIICILYMFVSASFPWMHKSQLYYVCQPDFRRNEFTTSPANIERKRETTIIRSSMETRNDPCDKCPRKKIHILRVLETPFVTNRQINTFQSTDWLTP